MSPEAQAQAALVRPRIGPVIREVHEALERSAMWEAQAKLRLGAWLRLGSKRNVPRQYRRRWAWHVEDLQDYFRHGF